MDYFVSTKIYCRIFGQKV